MIVLKTPLSVHAPLRDCSTTGLSERQIRAKRPEQAALCKKRGFCLDVSANLGLSAIPCQGCKRREDISPWDLEDDVLNCLLLVAAVLYPEIYRRYLFWQVRQQSEGDYLVDISDRIK